MSEVNKRFSPSFWTKRYSQEVAVDKFIEVSKKISEEITQEIPSTLNIPYGDKKREKYDIFGIDLPNDAPILIYIHGGYWQYEVVTKDTSRIPARSLYKLGIKTIIIGYNLCPEYTLEEINDKVTYGIKKCLDYAFEKGSRSIGIAGHSAGAQLTLISTISLFNTLPKIRTDVIKGIFLLGGIFNLEEVIETSYNIPLKLNKNKAKELSPIFKKFNNLNDKIKFFTCIGSDDCPGFIEQSKSFHKYLISQNLQNQSEFISLKDIDHYNLIENLQDVNFEIIKLIQKTLLN